MTRLSPALFACILITLPLEACHRQGNRTSDEAGASLPQTENAIGQDQRSSPTSPVAEMSAPPGFAPLRSDAVKDAIHRALKTGETQRWQDGAFTGYAVPSRTTDAHGCRAVHYTVDQQSDRSYPVITACDEQASS
jgi:hypothetical protein